MVKRDICCKDSMLITKGGIRHVELASHCKKKSQSFRSYFFFVPFPYQHMHTLDGLNERIKRNQSIDFSERCFAFALLNAFKKNHTYVVCLVLHIMYSEASGRGVCAFFWNFLRKQHNSPKKCNIAPILWFM